MNRILALSIRKQLVLLAALVALPAAGIIVLSGLRVRGQELQRAAVDTQQLAAAIAAEERNLVASAAQVVTVLAQVPEVRARDPHVTEALRALLVLNPSFSNLFIADLDGTVWASGVAEPGFTVGDRRYFVNAVRTGRLSSGEYIVSRATGKPSFNFGYPLRDASGRTIGVVCVGLSLDALKRRLVEVKLEHEPNFVLLDHDGTILARGADEGPWIGKPYPPDTFQEMELGPDAATFEGLGLVRDRRIITYRKLRLPGEDAPYMYVRVGIPVSTALADANEALLRNLALLLSFLLLAVAVMIRVGRRSIVDRLAALEDASRRVAAGDLSVRVSEAVAGGELGRLGTTFDAMAARLASREQALVESERNYREIFDATTDGIIVADAAGRILEVNRAVQTIFGRLRDDLLGTTLVALCPEAADRCLPRGKAVGAEPVEWRATRADGTPFWAEATAQPTSIGRDGRLLVVVRDVSARRRAAEATERLEAQLRHAQKLESIGRLAGGVAHDFNNMLTVILGEATVVHDASAPGSAVHESAEEITRAALRSRDVTRQLLAFGRRQVSAPRVVDLNGLAGELRQALARLIGEDVRLEIALAPGLWPVRLDPAQLDQVLVNLVVNARDAMPDGGRIVIETRNVVVEPGAPGLGGIPPGPYALLAVRDDGAGMDAETLSHLFEPFFTTKPQGKGTGLGLATVYGIVSQHGGFIRAESAPGAGATFRIYLPRVSGHPVVGAAAAAAPAAEPGRGRVLVVEDEAAVRATARRMLESLGYDVTAVGSAAEALALFERPDVAIDVVLTDVVMPEMKGTELRRLLGVLRPGLPTVLMSGHLAEAAADASGAAFLQKPFSTPELAREIRRALG